MDLHLSLVVHLLLLLLSRMMDGNQFLGYHQSLLLTLMVPPRDLPFPLLVVADMTVHHLLKEVTPLHTPLAHLAYYLQYLLLILHMDLLLGLQAVRTGHLSHLLPLTVHHQNQVLRMDLPNH